MQPLATSLGTATRIPAIIYRISITRRIPVPNTKFFFKNAMLGHNTVSNPTLSRLYFGINLIIDVDILKRGNKTKTNLTRIESNWSDFYVFIICGNSNLCLLLAYTYSTRINKKSIIDNYSIKNLFAFAFKSSFGESFVKLVNGFQTSHFQKAFPNIQLQQPIWWLWKCL